MKTAQRVLMAVTALAMGMSAGAAVDAAVAGAGAKSIADRVSRAKVAGVDLISYPTGVKDVVTIAGSLPAGDAFALKDDPAGNVAVPTLAGMMLDRGTAREDKFAIAQKLEDVGAQIAFGVEMQMVTIQAKCLKKDLPLVIGLIAEQLRAPAFAPDEFEKARQQFIGSLQASMEDPNFRAQEAYSRAVYPPGHPNRQPSPEDYLAAAGKAKLDEVKAFHRGHYGPAHLTLVVVGDLDPARVRREVGKAFSGWAGGVDVLRAARPVATTIETPREQTVYLASKTSVSILMGQGTGLRYRDPDALALRVGTAILGSGFTGRLMASVRDREGLTYGIGAVMAEDAFIDGSWSLTATFAPELLDKGIAASRRELRQWWSQGVTAQELQTRKQSLIGSFQVGLATTGGLATALLTAVQRGYEVDWLDRYPQAIDALTLEAVNTAIRKHLNPEKMVLVKAGTVPAG